MPSGCLRARHSSASVAKQRRGRALVHSSASDGSSRPPSRIFPGQLLNAHRTRAASPPRPTRAAPRAHSNAQARRSRLAQRVAILSLRYARPSAARSASQYSVAMRAESATPASRAACSASRARRDSAPGRPPRTPRRTAARSSRSTPRRGPPSQSRRGVIEKQRRIADEQRRV